MAFSKINWLMMLSICPFVGFIGCTSVPAVSEQHPRSTMSHCSFYLNHEFPDINWNKSLLLFLSERGNLELDANEFTDSMLEEFFNNSLRNEGDSCAVLLRPDNFEKVDIADVVFAFRRIELVANRVIPGNRVCRVILELPPTISGAT